MTRVFLGFAPWIAYWVIAGAGGRRAAPAAGLVAALVVGAVAARRRRLKTLDRVTLGFFVADTAVTLALGPDFLGAWDVAIAPAVLAAVAWGTLLAGTPFTLEYARDDWPREFWDAPLFRLTNTVLTATWGAIFTVNTALGLLGAARPAARVWLAGVLPQLFVALGVVASVLVPRHLPRRVLARQLRERDPYPWPPPAFRRAAAGDERRHDVVVVGAGIGGLTAGALLARRGLRVLVLEQHYLAGGFCTAWPRLVRRGETRLRYVFDAGVHDVSGLGAGRPVRHLLAALGLEDRLDWKRVSHRYLLPGLTLDVPERVDDFVGRLGEHFPEERAAIGAFFAEMAHVYRELYADAPATGGVPRPPDTVEAMLAYPPAHPHAFRWMQVPFGVMLDTFFRAPRLKQVLSILTGYLSDDPCALSVGAMAPIFGYYFEGGRYPVGGSQALADALVAAIEARGGRVALRTPVTRILVERGRAAGVECAGGVRHAADAVVANGDVRRTLLDLVGREHLPDEFRRRVEALAPATSAFAVFLGVDYVPEAAAITLVRVDDGGVFIAIPSSVDRSLAPPGHSAITLLALAPPDVDGEWSRKVPGYTARKRARGDALIALAERALPGLRDHVVYRQEGSPATFARYAWTTGGAIYGPAVGAWHPPARSPIEGLVLAGAGVFPGAGVEAVVISGTLAADALLPAAAPPAHEPGAPIVAA